VTLLSACCMLVLLLFHINYRIRWQGKCPHFHSLHTAMCQFWTWTHLNLK
jgi:hypothetical protein